MRYLMFLTVHVSFLSVISHSASVLEPLSFDNVQPEGNQDLSLISGLDQPLFGAESPSDVNGEIGSASGQCYGSTGGLQLPGKLRARQQCTAPNDKSTDEIQQPDPALQVPPGGFSTEDDECQTFLNTRFLLGKRFEWSVCDSGLWYDYPDHIIYTPNPALPGYITYKLLFAELCRFIKEPRRNLGQSCADHCGLALPGHLCFQDSLRVSKPWCCITFGIRNGIGEGNGCIEYWALSDPT